MIVFEIKKVIDVFFAKNTISPASSSALFFVISPKKHYLCHNKNVKNYAQVSRPEGGFDLQKGFRTASEPRDEPLERALALA
jgi:hypothetical protein